MDELDWADPEEKYRNQQRLLKTLGVAAAVALALCVCAVVGGGLIYGITQGSDLLPSAQAQWADVESGIVIASVVADGPAAAAGVVRGDILLEIDGKALDDAGDLLESLGRFDPGDEVELKVLHGDDLRTLTVALGDKDGRAYLGVVPCGGLSLEREVEVQVEVPVSGAVIVEVTAGSPAEEAGLQEGDIIVSVDGQELSPERGLADFVTEYQPGDRVALEIERPGEESQQVMVELGEHPEQEGVAYLGVRYSAFPGMETMRGLPPGHLDEFDLDELPFALPGGEIQGGAIIREITEDSPAAAAGLEEGDVITEIDGEPIDGPQALVDAVAGHEPGDQVTLTVYQPADEEEREVKVILGEHPEEEGRAYLGVSIGGFFQGRSVEGGELPPGFRFRVEPFEGTIPWDEMPFDLDQLPFDWEELPFNPEDMPFDLDDLPFDWDELPQPAPEAGQSA